MTNPGPNTSRTRLLTLAVPALVASLAIAACSNDDGGGGTTGLPASTSYAGLWTSNTGGTGPLSITFTTAVKAPPVSHNDIAGASSAPNNATGTVGVNGTPVAISGALDGSDLHMTATSGTSGLDLVGTLSNGVITGDWTTTTPADGGHFAAASNTDATPARAYCGQYSGTVVEDQSTESGTFSDVIAGTQVHGVASDGEFAEEFTGTAVPGASGGTFKVNQSITGGGTLKIEDGVYDETGTSGHYSTLLGTTVISNGTFTGNKDCPVL